MVHPRLYWGKAGNDLTPALIELPISRNHKHGGWTGRVLLPGRGGSGQRQPHLDIFNQNGWGRSLHFLAAWFLVAAGAALSADRIFGGHFRAHVWPAGGSSRPRQFWRDVADHLRLRIPAASGGPQLRPAAEVRVHLRRLRGGAADGR